MLSQKISKYSEDTYKDLFDHLYEDLLDWIICNPEIIPIVDIEDFRIYFYLFLLNQNHNYLNEYNEYFVLKYSDNIVDLFLSFKDICSSYGTIFLHEKGRSANDLLEFISKFSIINEDYENELMEEYGENSLDYEIH